VRQHANTNISTIHADLSKKEAPTNVSYALPGGRVVREGD
jgi:hypothetical protein